MKIHTCTYKKFEGCLLLWIVVKFDTPVDRWSDRFGFTRDNYILATCYEERAKDIDAVVICSLRIWFYRTRHFVGKSIDDLDQWISINVMYVGVQRILKSH